MALLPALVDVPGGKPESTSSSPNPTPLVSDAETAVGTLFGVSVALQNQRTIVFQFTINRPPGTVFSANDAGSRDHFHRTLEINEISAGDSDNGHPMREVAWELPDWSQIEHHVPDVLAHMRETFIDKQVTMQVGERKDVFTIRYVSDNGFESNYRAYFELWDDPLKPRPGVRLHADAEKVFIWGEPTNGLRAGILPPLNDFVGERYTATWTLAVQNVGRRPVEITTSTHPLIGRRRPLVSGATMPRHDLDGGSSAPPSKPPANGAPKEPAERGSATEQSADAATPKEKSTAKLVVSFSEPREIERRSVRRYRLMAGEAVILSTRSVIFGQRDEYDWKLAIEHDQIFASPGDKLTIGYSIRLPEATCRDEAGQPFVPLSNEWRGRLSTGTFPLRLLASEDATREYERLAQQGPSVVGGRVEDHQGRRLAGVSITVEMGTDDLQLVAETVTDRSGDFRVRIPTVDSETAVQRIYVTPRLPGYFPVDLGSAGKTTAIRPQSDREKQIVEASGKGSRHLVLVMQPAARLHGRLLGQDGRPLAKQVLALEGDSPFPTKRFRSRPREVTDSDGCFEFPEIAAGIVRHLVTEVEGIRYHGSSFKLSPAQTRLVQVTVDRPGTATLLMRNVDETMGATVAEEIEDP